MPEPEGRSREPTLSCRSLWRAASMRPRQLQELPRLSFSMNDQFELPLEVQLFDLVVLSALAVLWMAVEVVMGIYMHVR